MTRATSNRITVMNLIQELEREQAASARASRPMRAW